MGGEYKEEDGGTQILFFWKMGKMDGEFQLGSVRRGQYIGRREEG